MKRLKEIIASLMVVLSFFRCRHSVMKCPFKIATNTLFLRIEHEWLRALVERDRATLDRILADEFVDSN